MLKLYGVLRSRITRNVWLAREMGVPFERVPVIQTYRLKDPHAADAPMHTRHPAFLAVNPDGHVPFMDDDGFTLGESLAINLYLARKHGGPLAPRDVREEAQAIFWSLWGVTEVETHALTLMNNRVNKPLAERDAAAADAAAEALRKPFGVLDAHLAREGHPVGRRFTVADINVAECCRYAQCDAALMESVPHLKAWIEACQARPVFKQMWAERNAEPA